MTLPRGFKADAERRAAAIRAQLGRCPRAAVDARDLAMSMDLAVIAADSLVERARLQELEQLQAYAFSAATFLVDGKHVIVVNPLHSEGRQNSSIAHELSHILLNHQLSEIQELDGTPFRTCNPSEEEQATALGGTLLLPRPLLLDAARQGLGVTDIATNYRVTEDMARYRYNTTGVARQASPRPG
jgi:Zn-dependent peptidase ImmA (M78 family)